MNAESIQILRDMGFNSVASRINVPSHTELGMSLTCIRNGNTIIVFCNGGQAEYDTLANHGAVLRRKKGDDFESTDAQRFVAGGIPYLTLPTERLFFVFRSIAMMRLLESGDTTRQNEFWTVANTLATAWINGLPSEGNALYQRDIAADTFEESLAF